MLLDKIFVTTYLFFKGHYAFKNFSMLEYRVVGVLTFVITLNLMTLSKLILFDLIEELKGGVICVAILVYLILLYMYTKQNKIGELLMEWKNLSDAKRKKDRKMTIIYILFSTIVFVLVNLI